MTRPPLPPGPLLVVGLARSGVAAALAARARGRRVVGVDGSALAPESAQGLRAAGVELHAPHDGVDLLVPGMTVVKSPGVPQEAPVVVAARRRGLPVIGELELAWRLLPNSFIAVTGSNGKTTCVEWLGHIFAAARRPARVAGNVGTALSSLAGAIDHDVVVICEASSFQLEDSESFAPEVAILLNLADDHLDRHKTSAAYRTAKLQIFARQPPDAVAVLPDDFDSADVGGSAGRLTFGAHPGSAMREHDGALWWRGSHLIDSADIRLRGAHNRSNAMAAAAGALSFGIAPDAVVAGLKDFPGVAHRLEAVASVGGVTYVNDSKATNVASAVVGIGVFPRGVHVILGGRDKGSDYAPLAPVVSEHCRAAYLIGETAPAIRAVLESTGVPTLDCGSLDVAVARARAAARPGDVVLLSPACASFDQFESFEHRGQRFRALVFPG